MKRTLIISILLLNAITLAAIKPNRAYSYTPDKLDLTYEEFKVKTDDGFILNGWHLPSEGEGTPIIISQSDAGNMGDWLYLGLYLQAYGLDVWMYDYRGFGQSDDFKIVQNQLFHTEFIQDLKAVAEHICQKTGMSPALLGISMGTIIVNEYLRVADIPVSKVVFDGYVSDPKAWNSRLAANGKTVTLPDGYKNRKYRQKNQDALFIVSEKDAYSTLSDIPKAAKGKQVVKTFDCEHISGFFRYPEEYVSAVVEFLTNLSPLSTMAQEPQIIGGYLLDGKDSFEELDAAVVTDSKREDKNLDGKGMRLPGGAMMMIPESVGKEIGSIVPQENLELEPGEYYISFALTEISKTIENKWAASETWDAKERYVNQLEDSMFFPVYVKSSYSRSTAEQPLEKWKYNIGMTVRGKIVD